MTGLWQRLQILPMMSLRFPQCLSSKNNARAVRNSQASLKDGGCPRSTGRYALLRSGRKSRQWPRRLVRIAVGWTKQGGRSSRRHQETPNALNPHLGKLLPAQVGTHWSSSGSQSETRRETLKKTARTGYRRPVPSRPPRTCLAPLQIRLQPRTGYNIIHQIHQLVQVTQHQQTLSPKQITLRLLSGRFPPEYRLWTEAVAR